MRRLLTIPIILISFGLLFSSCSDNSSSAPEIISVNPLTGGPGTAVTINGTGFNSDASKVAVAFNGVPAAITSTSAEQIEVTVPEGATSGAVTVEVKGKSATGPAFTVDARLNYEGDYESEDYDMLVVSSSGGTSSDTTLALSHSSDVEIELVSGSDDEIEMDLEEFLQDGLTEVLSILGGSTGATLNVLDDPIAEVDGNEFELDDTDIEIIDGTDTLPGEVTGEGTLESDGTIIFTFEFFVQGSGSTLTFSGEVELERN